MRLLLTLLASVVLAGYVDFHTTLRDPQGHTAVCNNLGIGVIGSAIEIAAHHACVKRLEAAGYTE